MPKYARRKDASQSEIVDAILAAGWQVEYTFRLGHGVPDLVAWKPGGPRIWVECKTALAGLTADEERAIAFWLPGHVVVVHNGQEAVDALAGLALQRPSVTK